MTLWVAQSQFFLLQSSDLKARDRLRSTSSSSSSSIIRRTRLSTVGHRTFQFAAARVWNKLPRNINLRRPCEFSGSHLKTHLFGLSFPDFNLLSFCEMTCVIIGHFNRFYLLTYLLCSCSYRRSFSRRRQTARTLVDTASCHHRKLRSCHTSRSNPTGCHIRHAVTQNN